MADKQAQTTVDKRETVHLPHYLRSKRDEIIWSLAKQQEYSPETIRQIFNFKHLSTVTRTIDRMPEGWMSPWIKR